MIKLNGGAIFQIPLPKELGFAYAKYIDLLKMSTSISLPDMIKVYDYKTEGEKYDLETMQKQDYLLNPLLVAGLPPTIRKGVWKIIEDVELNQDDLKIHDFSRNENWLSNTDNWYYCIGANTPLSADGTGVIEIKVAMAFLMKEGKSVGDYFELKEYYETATYEELKRTPPYYRLPKEMRDKAIGAE